MWKTPMAMFSVSEAARRQTDALTSNVFWIHHRRNSVEKSVSLPLFPK
jgi:hypothetical protein